MKEKEVSQSFTKAINNVFGFEWKIYFCKFFFSKKNQVTLLTLKREKELKQVLAKFFVWGDREKEEEILNLCASRNVKVPKVLGSFSNILFMEYLPGKSLGKATKEELFLYIPLLINWLTSFGEAFKDRALCRGDITFSNFIWFKEEIYGIDFEEVHIGNLLEDIKELTINLLLKGFTLEELKNIYPQFIIEDIINFKKSIFTHYLCKKFIWGDEETKKRCLTLLSL